MKAGKYNIKELFVNRYVQQIIIPEIQRDYVWKREQVQGLLDSIINDYNLFKAAEIPLIESTDDLLVKSFAAFYKKRNYSSNIGFIYAYNDEQYHGKYFLIDGQQRITTIFIILLALASLNEGLKEKFKATYLLNQNIKLDYKVRELTHDFINAFVLHVLEGEKEFVNQHWYLPTKYNTDTTIQSWLTNFNFLSNYFIDKTENEVVDFYYFIEDQVEFWYFDTNISEQGEELYIYMNARGEQMQSNENLKADLLSKFDNIDEKNSYGILWEDWQDFFWENKGKNENADIGFNEFLFCIAGLENIRNGKKNIYQNIDNYGVKYALIKENLDISIIKRYFDAYKYLIENKENFKGAYGYCDWVDNCLNDLKKLFNETNTNWFADIQDNNKGTERNRMIFIWSILYFNTSNEDLNIDGSFRIMRMFYLRYHNFNRSVSTLFKTIDEICENGLLYIHELEQNNGIKNEVDQNGNDSKQKTNDEIIRIKILNKFKDLVVFREIESVLWEIEDHRLNLNGRNVGATNISHLIHGIETISLEQLNIIKDKFFEIFPLKEIRYLTIQNVLLYYSEYWDRVSPYYYENYRFDNWAKIIREHIINPEKETVAFKEFFKEFLDFNGSIHNFLETKKIDFTEIEKIDDLRTQLTWYAQKLNSKLWSKGNNIALRDWENNDAFFSNQRKIINTQGNFKGYNHIEISKLVENHA
jgi:uncharacterized protein with ParB-like and HNH nuclease domain